MVNGPHSSLQKFVEKTQQANAWETDENDEHLKVLRQFVASLRTIANIRMQPMIHPKLLALVSFSFLVHRNHCS